MGLAKTVETCARKYAPLAKALEGATDLIKDGYSEALWRLLPSEQPIKKGSFDNNISNAYDSIRNGRIAGGGAIFWYDVTSDSNYSGIAKSRRLKALEHAIDQGAADKIRHLLSLGEVWKSEYGFFEIQKEAKNSGIKIEKLQRTAIDIAGTYMELAMEKFEKDNITATIDYDRGIEFAEKSGLPLAEIQSMKLDTIMNLKKIGIDRIMRGDYYSASTSFDVAIKIAQTFGVHSNEAHDLAMSFMDAYAAKGESQGLQPVGLAMSIIGIQGIIDRGFTGAQVVLNRLKKIGSAVIRGSALEAAIEDSGGTRLVN